MPAALVEHCIDTAAKACVLHGRDPVRDIEVGGDRVWFGTGATAVNTLDLDSRLCQPSTLRDLHDFTRLQDTLDSVAWFTRCCIATDVTDPFDLDVNTAFAQMKNATRPVATAFTLGDHVDPIVAIFGIVAGGNGAFARRPFVKAHISPVISPMRFDEDAVDVFTSVSSTTSPCPASPPHRAGATAPAPLAGFLAQSLAKTLASLVMVNVIYPGFPMVFPTSLP